MDDETATEIMLIKLVKEKRIIYDPQYCKLFLLSETRRLRESAWLGIARKLGVSKVVCQSMWVRLKTDLLNSLNNRYIVRVPGISPYVLATYKYEKQMEFLLPHIGFSKRPKILNYPKEKLKRIMNRSVCNDDPERKKLRLSSNENEAAVIEIRSDNEENEDDNSNNNSNTANDDDNNINNNEDSQQVEEDSNCNGSQVCETTEEADGELIMQLNDETIIIPTKYIGEDNNEEIEGKQEDDDGDIYLNCRPAENSVNSNECSSAIPIEVDFESTSDSDIEIEIPVQAFKGKLNIDKELGLELDTSHETDRNNEIVLVTKDKNEKAHSTRKIKGSPKRLADRGDDAEGEEYFYSALAMSANQISNYRERLLLRKEITKVVMEAVAKHLEKNEAGEKT